VKPSAGLPREEVGEELSLDVLRDQHGNRRAPDEDRLFRVVVDDDRAVAELVELSGVELRRLVAQVAMGKEELGRSLDPGALLSNPVDLALPAAPEAGNDFVFPSERTPGNEIERFDSQRAILSVRARLLGSRAPLALRSVPRGPTPALVASRFRAALGLRAPLGEDGRIPAARAFGATASSRSGALRSPLPVLLRWLRGANALGHAPNLVPER
jgi:hypothetical protein